MTGGKWKNISLNANNALTESCKFSLKFAIKKTSLGDVSENQNKYIPKLTIFFNMAKIKIK